MCKLCRCPLRNKVIFTGEKVPAEAAGNKTISGSNRTRAARYQWGHSQLQGQRRLLMGQMGTRSPVCAGGSWVVSQKHHRHSAPPWVSQLQGCLLPPRADREDLIQVID